VRLVVRRATPATLPGVAGRPIRASACETMVLDCQAVGTTSAENPTNKANRILRHGSVESQFWTCVPLFVEVSISVVRSPETAYEIVYAGPSLAAAKATIRDLFAQSVVALRMRPI
jgi:hypothetical protein